VTFVNNMVTAVRYCGIGKNTIDASARVFVRQPVRKSVR